MSWLRVLELFEFLHYYQITEVANDPSCKFEKIALDHHISIIISTPKKIQYVKYCSMYRY